MSKKTNYDNWSKEELIKELKRIKETKYGLVWHRDLPEEKIDTLINPAARTPNEMFPNEMAGKPFPVLKEDKNREIVTNDKQPINILIEGDNYHSLAVLNFTHEELIDLIYIDPPYNTGNNEFKYNDRIVDKEDPYRHSKWLSFMEKRLKLAKNLLKKTGMILISIDDNEQAQLKLLCDEVFGESNFITSIVWQKIHSIKNDAKHMSINHDYIMFYCKNIDHLDVNLLSRTEDMDARYKNPDNDARGLWQSGDLVANEVRTGGDYPVKGPTGKIFHVPSGKHWVYSKENMQQLIKEKRIWFGKSGDAFPRKKRFLSDVIQGRKSSSWWPSDEVGHNQEAKRELKMFFNQSEDLFSTPKPVRLIKRIINLCNNKNALILDFMAGSGTTGHAVLELNKEDKGNRQFILCTNNENSICSDICYPRLKKVINGHKIDNGTKTPGMGGSLKYFTAYDFVESEPTDKNKRILVDKSAEMLCLKENAFEPVLNKSDFKIYKNKNKHLGIIFYEDAISDFKKEIKNISGHFNVYVFSLGDDPHEKEFKDVKNRVTLCAIPEVILKVYREIFKQ